MNKPANQMTSQTPTDNSAALRRMFDFMPESFKRKVINSFSDSRTNKGAIYLNYDVNFGDFFQSPFIEKGDVGTWTVAKYEHGAIVPFELERKQP